jgi:TolB-like protein/DNA-binding winged helix-turn-helix (wHTH) protein
MEKPTLSSRVIRVGEIDLDTRTGELSGVGRKIQLTVQPLQVLLVLLEHPGELVTREELVNRVWPAGTFVDFDHSLNKAVNKLRDALGDSADAPRFIETLPRRGYRIIAPVVHQPELEVPAVEAPPPPELVPDEKPALGLEDLAPPPVTRRFPYRMLAIGIAACAALLVLLNVGGLRGLFLAWRRPAHAQIASLAVLPLENLSGDPEQSYFADGMTDALITEVSKVGATHVISRTSVMRYKGNRKSVQQVGRELNVDAVVEGTIMRSGNRVRITAQLIQVSTDMHLWAESFERDMSEVLTLQQEVAANIARRIGAVVKPVESRSVNPEAYGAYLKGRFYFLQYTADGWQKAIDNFNLAVQADPNFAPAHSGLAQSYLVAAGWNTFPPDEALRNGKAEARRALELDDSLASSHLAMGVVYDQEFDRKNAEREFSRGLELDPNDSLAWQQHGNHLLSDGRFSDAIAEQERALRLDPLSPVINANLARAFYYSRQYDQAIARAQETLKLEPNYPIALMWLERAYRHKGMLAEAFAAQLAACRPENRAMFERAYRASGYRAILLLEAEEYNRTRSLVEAARGYAQAGQYEQAWAALEEARKKRWPGLDRLKVDPDFDPLRSDPRYQQLLRQAGLD